jgi:uncharacterized protein (TIGR03437 family)
MPITPIRQNGTRTAHSVAELSAISPGGLSTIFGTSLAPDGTSAAVQSQDLVNGGLPVQLAKTCVRGGELPAYLTYVSSRQINFQVPDISAAGPTAIQVVAKEGAMVSLRLPSSEVRMVRGECRATVGTLSNAEHQNIKVGKAGRNRHKGKRPQTRGVAMNPVDHPHGGGEAHHTPGGHPVTPWGKPTLGYRTRKKGKRSDALIVRGRRRGKRK